MPDTGPPGVVTDLAGATLAGDRDRGDRVAARWLRTRTPAVHVALVVLAVYALLGLSGRWLAPYSPTDFDMKTLLKPPSWRHPFGTDGFGRDVFSRVVAGTGTILVLSLGATTLGVGLGSAVGLASGYAAGRRDELIMRVMDVLMALPTLLLALLIITALGASKGSLVFAIGIVFVPRSARIARSSVLALRNAGYIEAARLRGEHPLRILLAEIVPNVRDVVGVEFCLRFAYSLLLISSLGFLGLGVQPPEPDWGQMISEGRNFITIAWWTVLFPSIAIGGLVVAVTLVADGLWQDGTRLASARLI